MGKKERCTQGREKIANRNSQIADEKKAGKSEEKKTDWKSPLLPPEAADRSAG